MENWKQEIFRAIAELLETEAAADAAELLAARSDFQALAAEFPASADSLRGQLTRPQARESTAVLRGFPGCAPSVDVAAWSAIAVPTLVIANGDDPIHPFEIGEAYARQIPGAKLVSIPSRERNPTGFSAGFQAAVQDFLEDL